MSELTPYLCVGDRRAALEWYDVLGAEVVVEPIVMDDGRIGHVEMAVDGAKWMMADPSQTSESRRRTRSAERRSPCISRFPTSTH
jgi:PhnB protein